MKYVVALVALVIPAIFGCTGGPSKGSGDDAVPREGGVVTAALRAMETKEETEAREDRAALREHLRAKGERVCEEGEHGGEPWLSEDGCNTCGCYEGVRLCTKKHCRDSSTPLGLHPGPHCSPPPPPPPPLWSNGD
jgi:hypothetical protein